MPDEAKPVLLVDGRNLMYRAIFANKSPNSRDNHHHFTVMVSLMWGWIDRFKPEAVNVFWDAPRETVWRKKIFENYKNRDDKDYYIDIREDLIYTQAAAQDILQHMGVLQFSRPHMEADDLIYAAARVLAPKQVYIISSDSDYTQVAFRMPHVRLFDPLKNKFIDPPDFDPAVQKALAGDKADKINGYEGIGPKKSAKLAASLTDRHQFLIERGAKLFIRNLLLIDLSLCPDLLKNILYVQDALTVVPKFDKEMIFSEAKKHQVNGLVADYSRSVLPFKLMLESTEEEKAAVKE